MVDERIDADGARVLDDGLEAGFAFAVEELVGLFGSDVRRCLRPLAASHWSQTVTVGGYYSCTLA